MNDNYQPYVTHVEAFWKDFWSRHAPKEPKQMNATYTVEMYPSEYGEGNLDWTIVTPQLCFEEAHTVCLTLTKSCPGYRYRITKIARED